MPTLPPARALPLIVALVASPASLPAKDNPADRVVCREGFLQIVSPDPVTADQCRRAARLAMAAWRFDEGAMQWRGWANMQAPLKLRLLSDERMEKEQGKGTRAAAFTGGKTFVMRTSLVDDPSGPKTLAHELGHVQSYRALANDRAKKEVPDYFFEAHGLSLNRLWNEKHPETDDPSGWTSWPKSIKSTGADVVKLVYSDSSYRHGEKDPGKSGKIHLMGLYMVEYLHGHHHLDDVVRRMGRVFEEVGRGKSYAAAFRDQMGVALDTVIAEIVDLFERTASDPAKRLEGTRFLEWAGKS